jgi:O-antigen ligase
MTISGTNAELPGINIKIKPILGLVVLIMSLTSKCKIRIPPFLNSITNKLIICFFLYLLLLSWGTGSITSQTISSILLSVVTAYLGYYSFSIKGNADYIKISLVIAGIVCFSDLVYTYTVFGTFPVQRLSNYFIQSTIDSTEEMTNHNFFGFICGISFVLILSDYINDRLVSKFFIYLIPVMFLGVIMSTSRSTLLGLIAVTLILVVSSSKNPVNAKRAYRILGLAFGVIAGVLVLFFSAQALLHLDSTFMDNITARLTEEPIAVIRKNLGYSYNINDLDSFDWREQSAAIAFQVFMGLPFMEQFFGIGIGAYLQRNLGHNGLNPHNGILYVLLETGIFGFCQYLAILTGIVYQTILRKYLSSIFLVLIFIIFYCLGQNEELISATTILFITTVAAENNISSYLNIAN